MLYLILLLLTTIILSCEDSTQRDFAIDFSGDIVSAPDNSITLSRADSEVDELMISVDINNLSSGNAHSFYFDVRFDNSIMTYSDFQKGVFLEKGGGVTYQVGLDSMDSNRLIVGISLLDPGSSSTGDGTLVLLRFKPTNLGFCPFEILNTWIRDNQGTQGVILTGISWYGGSAQVAYQ